MEAQSRVVWDFLRLSYQRGLMDDLMALGDLMDPNMDFVDALESFEEMIMDMDLKPLTLAWQEQLHPLIVSLTNPQAIDALRAILQALRPQLEKLTAAGGQTALRKNLQTLVALKPHLAVLLHELAPVAAPLVQKFVREDLGRLLGHGLNTMSDAILKSQAREPELAHRVFTDLFSALDTKQFGGAMEVVLGGLLDQRPKVVRWTLGAAFTRIKKRFGRA